MDKQYKGAEALHLLMRDYKDDLIARGQFFELSVLLLSRSLKQVFFPDGKEEEDFATLNKQIGDALGKEEWERQSHIFTDFFEELHKIVPPENQHKLYPLLLEYIIKSVTDEDE